MTCHNCDGEISEFDGGYVCPACCLVVLDGAVTGWQVYSRRMFEDE